ncbi:MAG TPA: IS630 family transposase [Terracidiphilus sp.]|nr:IS630 family transposase [Terracidiphilus sp.]
MAKKEGMSRTTLRKILLHESPPGYGGIQDWEPEIKRMLAPLAPKPLRADAVRRRWMEWIYDLERGVLDEDALSASLSHASGNVRKRILAVMASERGFSANAVGEHLRLSRATVRNCLLKFNSGGLESLLGRKPRPRMADNESFGKALFSLLHEPPSLSGFNRTTWRMEDLRKTLAAGGLPAGDEVIREAIRKAGFRWRSAKVVLTSNDPGYREKLAYVRKVLSNLGNDERFFSIDEYGPFAIKAKPGRVLAGRGESPSVPQWQKSKGWLIVTAALELSRNRVTHFYSRAKNTLEMIKMAETLVEEYPGARTLYLSWDAASWHMSKKLLAFVEAHNVKGDHAPRIELVPLPASAQFLNVIESVFSGMARAIIHNSNYPSVRVASEAIDRYFEERNQHFAENPERAGNRIWGKERTEATFDLSNNCKDPAYR